MAFLQVCYSNNIMKTDVKYLSSRTDLEDSFPLPFSPSNAGGNNRLQGTPNRANARPGAPEAERSAHWNETHDANLVIKDV
jgi:hypothetical protein